MNTGDDFRPTAPLEHLRRRAELLKRVRTFFEDRSFLEVTTPLLSRDTIVDRHLDPFRVTVFDDPRRHTEGETWYLQTSPEFHMKRLLAAGATAIYQITQAFRAGEVGALHNIEFTMLEWYRVGDDMQAGMNLLAELVEEVGQLGQTERLTYQSVFERFVGLDPFDASLDDLRRAAQEIDSSDRDDLLDWLLVRRIAPHLGKSSATIVFDFPPSQAALAKVRTGDVNKAERFELFLQGVELANGYHELCSADELRARIATTNSLRASAGKPELPEQNRLLSAMESGLPNCSGVALGFDRLAMLAMSETTVDKAISFGFSRA